MLTQLNLFSEHVLVVVGFYEYAKYFTFDVEDTNLPKEIPFTQHSKLCDPIIRYDCKFSLFDDVHLMAYISFPADVLSWTEHLQGKRHEKTLHP